MRGSPSRIFLLSGFSLRFPLTPHVGSCDRANRGNTGALSGPWTTFKIMGQTPHMLFPPIPPRFPIPPTPSLHHLFPPGPCHRPTKYRKHQQRSHGPHSLLASSPHLFPLLFFSAVHPASDQQALAIDQVHETSAALSWAMDHIHEYGGNPSRIFLTGHSSGAHVCSMVVWRRFRSALRRMFQVHGKDVASAPTAVAEADSSSVSSSASREGESPQPAVKREDLWFLDEPDLRQPYCFLGMSNVYDIAHHQRHEQRGGVFALSAISPAIGGPARFVSTSPAPLFDTLTSAAADIAAAAARVVAAGAVAGRNGDAVVGGASAAASFGTSFDCPKSPLLVATATPTAATTSTPSAPSPPSTSAIARSRALKQLAPVSADAAASLRPTLPPSNLRHPTHLPRQLIPTPL
ncbi:unnamed protein product [Closterium sp. NIES-53]